MHKRTTSLVLSMLIGVTASVGCAVLEAGEPEADDAARTDEAELRALRAGELAGSIACGETRRVHHAGTPTYRALSIAAKKGQALDVRVSAPGHDARAWLTSASNATRAANDDADGGTRDARIVYTAKSDQTLHVVFREKNFEEEVDFDVTLACSGGAIADAGAPDAAPPPSDDAFDPASCAGPQMTKAEAIAKMGAGSSFSVLAPAKKLMARRRACNPVTGCSAWGAPAPASHTFYMAGGGDNYNLPRGYDVHLMLAVAGSGIDAVIEDVSNRGRCAGCGPSGITYSLDSSSVRGFHGNSTLFINYPRWTHTSSGFQIYDTWAPVDLGPSEGTTFTVTGRCTRAAILSSDGETEYAVLYRY